MDQIKAHFQEEATEYDRNILSLVPFYAEMTDALTVGLPIHREAPLEVIDIGCGTGNIARKIRETFPFARITCLDFADNMLKMASLKLGEGPDMRYVLGDIRTWEFDRLYDVVVSSLALHHLETDEEKKGFFRKVSGALLPGGYFYAADIVLGQSDAVQDGYMEKWKEFMRRTVTDEMIESRWIPGYEQEDRPSRLVDQLEWLKELGFAEVDVIWKYYNFAVYGGRIPNGK